MAETTVRAAIKTIVDGVGNEGLVYDYERWQSTWQAYLTLFKTTIDSTDQIRAWTISCASFTQERIEFRTEGKAGILRTYQYIIRGYLGLDDSAATEKTAIALAEDVVEALDDADTIRPPTAGFYDAQPAQLRTFELRMFGDVLCHYIEIGIIIQEFKET